MSKVDELWEKYWDIEAYGQPVMTKSDFLAALAEYGKAVRDRDAEICNRLERTGVKCGNGRVIASSIECAAAISREPMP